MPSARVRFTRSSDLRSIRTRPLMTKIIKRGLDSLGRTLKSRVRGLSPKDREIFVKSIYYGVTGNTLSNLSLTVGSTDNPKKVAVIEKGRGRNKRRPPVAELRGWVRRKGLKLTKNYRASRRLGPKTPDKIETPGQVERRIKKGLRLKAQAQAKAEKRVRPLSKRQREINSLAFMIGRSIGKKGVRGRGVFAKVTRQNRDLIKRSIQGMNTQIGLELSR